MRTEPFNLDSYLKDPTKKVVTRDGRSVRILATDLKNDNYPIVGTIPGEDGEIPNIFTKEGKFFNGPSLEVEDLMFEVTPKEYWVNVYRDVFNVYTGSTFDSREKAMGNIIQSEQQYLTTIKIWEE
jgi:hypothetical protein